MESSIYSKKETIPIKRIWTSRRIMEIPFRPIKQPSRYFNYRERNYRNLWSISKLRSSNSKPNEIFTNLTEFNRLSWSARLHHWRSTNSSQLSCSSAGNRVVTKFKIKFRIWGIRSNKVLKNVQMIWRWLCD